MKIQGDIAFIPMKAENIEFKKLENALVVAEGEVTGHKHVLERVKESDVAIGYDENGQMFMRVVKGEAIITHPQHAPITFPIGDWKIIRQREYDELGERRVQD